MQRKRPIVTGRVTSSFRLSVCPSVGNETVLWKNGRGDRDAVSGGGSSGPKEPCVIWACTSAPSGTYGRTIVRLSVGMPPGLVTRLVPKLLSAILF